MNKVLRQQKFDVVCLCVKIWRTNRIVERTAYEEVSDAMEATTWKLAWHTLVEVVEAGESHVNAVRVYMYIV